VQLYRKDYSNGNPDFVQVVNLKAGARLEFLHGDITESRLTKGVYGGADPRMTALPIQTYWDQVRQVEEDAFCVANGLFFYMPEYPTRLSFPLKIDGRIVTDGWGINTYVGEQLLLELWEDRAAIVPLTEMNLRGSTAPDLIGGLTEQANKRAKFSVGRTFFGIDDRDDDGAAETVLVFSTLSATQTAAAETLRSLGADRVMMLDGGGSTQLLCRSGSWVESDRPIPQAIAVIPAEEPPISARLIGHSNWTVIMEGERLPLEVQIENTGVLSWTTAATTFVIQPERLELEERQAPEETVPPGKTLTLRENVVMIQQSGVLPVTIGLSIEQAGEKYALEPLEFQTIVLPYQLQAHKQELQAELSKWIAERPQETSELASQWIEEQLNRPAEPLELEAVNQIRPIDATFVPLLMLPIMALIAWAIARSRQ
jgi:hypothetical protein